MDIRAEFLKMQRSASFREEGQFYAEQAANSLLDRFYHLLDGCNPLFIPCPLASKKASVCYAELTHDNLDSFYLEKLCEVAVNEGNLAVKLGPISGNLCAFDIDRDELVEPFLAVNPALEETLRTKGRKGCQFWFKVDGPYPEKIVPLVDGNEKPVGEWRGGGNGLSTIHGVHPSSARHIKTFVPPYRWLRYRFVVEKPIITIHYDDINTPGWTIKKRKPGERFKWSSNSDEQ
jgi:hypothetical protein